MSVASVFSALIRSSPSLVHISLSLFWTYLTLGRRVRKVRRAFERQLISQGMSKDDAKRISACYNELKNNLVAVVKMGVTAPFSG